MLRRSKELIQAYRQTPWRRQMQLFGFFAAAVIGAGLLAALYLNITARAATAGRIVQDLQDQRADLQQRIEDLETQLAFITSIEQMGKRAEDLGFEPVSPGAVTYLEVQGYKGLPVVELAPKAGTHFAGGTRMPAEYTESLFDWLAGIIQALGGH